MNSKEKILEDARIQIRLKRKKEFDQRQLKNEKRRKLREWTG